MCFGGFTNAQPCVQVLLLAKAVVVAIAGHEWLWPEPKHRGAAGLVYLYAAISSSLIALSVLRRSATALIEGERLQSPVLTALPRTYRLILY